MTSPADYHLNCTLNCVGILPDPFWWVDPLYHLLLGMIPLLVVLFFVSIIIWWVWLR